MDSTALSPNVTSMLLSASLSPVTRSRASRLHSVSSHGVIANGHSMNLNADGESTWASLGVASVDDPRASYAFHVFGDVSSDVLAIVIPGLGDTVGSLHWASRDGALAKRARVARFDARSSGGRHGERALESDVEDLTLAIDWLRKEVSETKVTIVGHSTGCQIACAFLASASGREASERFGIERVVLQAGVSDRDWYDHAFGKETMEEAIARARAIPGEALMPVETPGMYGVPTTARRFLSLAREGGDDDWFSLDLFDESTKSLEGKNKIARLTTCADVDVRLVVSTRDEYVPYDSVTVRAHNERVRAEFEAVAKSAKVLYVDANHDLSDASDADIDRVVDFILAR